MMIRVGAMLFVSVAALPLQADFSYQEEAKITGGAMAAMMKFAGAFSKQAREPIVSHTYVKGHRIAHANPHGVDIIDVDKETMTHIDLDHKTYSVTTFAQLRDQVEQMSKQMNEKMAEEKQKNPDANVNMQVKVSANPTGQTKDIDGLTAKEIVMTVSLQGTDQQSGQTGSMDMKSDMWMASVPGYDEVRELYKLMGEKIGIVPGGGFLSMPQPELARNMGEMYKEMAKMDGMPVETVMQMGGSSTGSASGDTASNTSQPKPAPTPAPSASNIARAATLGRLGLGGFGGFGRHKKNSDQQQQQQQSSDAENTSASTNSSAPQRGLLMEMTMHASGFSTAAVDESNFLVPAGFRQVPSEIERQANQQNRAH